MTPEEVKQPEESIEKLIWSCIKPASKFKEPGDSDGYDEAEVYWTAVKVLQEYKESEEYKQIELDAAKWKTFLTITDSKINKNDTRRTR